MLIASISRTDAAPSPTATARRRISGASRSRCCGESVLESRTPTMRRACGFMITAAATTAPHVGATPTSSTPTTRAAPARQCTPSKRRLGVLTRPDLGRGIRSTIACSEYRRAAAREWRGRSERGVRPGRPQARRCEAARGEAGLASGAALAQRRCLADALAQEVQLRAADLAVADDLDLLDPRAVD